MKRRLPFIGQCGFSEKLLQYVPNAVEYGLLDSIVKDDEPFQSAMNALQRSGSTILQLNEVRTLFDTNSNSRFMYYFAIYCNINWVYTQQFQLY